MRKDDLAYMPNTRNLIASQGMTFDNAYVPLSSCCPSRASVMRGQYPHNHKVWLSSPSVDFPNQEGWEGYHAQGHENDNIATRLDATGYHTGIFGKYLNGYKDTTGKPAGWDDFFVKIKGQGYFNYNMNDNGTTVQYGSTEADYFTDVIEAETRNFIAQAAPNNPFYAEFTPNAPHKPTIPAPRHQNALDGLPLDKGPAYNEATVSDKPSFIQDDPIITAAGEEIIRQHNEDRAETLLAVDESVQDICDMVDAEGVLSNTYFIFTSDNGWMNGEHRIPADKQQPYEEGSEMPLLIAGPGITANTSTDKLASLIDIMPTVLDYAGVAAPSYMDGRSLKPVLEGTATSWRHNVLLETIKDNKLAQSYSGIVSDDGGTLQKYIEYWSGDKEYYNLNTDPNELNSDASAVPASLDSRLDALKVCAGDSCRSIENEGGGTPPPPPPDDTTPPKVKSTSPANGATLIAPEVNVTATFTEAMDAVTTDGDPSTINGATVKLMRAGTTTAIGAVVSYDATTNTAILNPNANLQLGTQYKAVVTTGAQDVAGNQLDQNSSISGLQQESWTFTIRN